VIPKIAHFHWEGHPINWMRMMGIFTFARLNPRWEIRIIRSPDHIREKNLDIYAMEADWAWIEALNKYGGFAMATDTVFVKPIPESWLDADMSLCMNGTGNFFHCCFGSVPDTEFLRNCQSECERIGSANPRGYQDLGVFLLKNCASALGGIDGMAKTLDIVDFPVDAITPVLWSSPEDCWGTQPLPITEHTVGVTWFGGHESSRNREWDVPHLHSDAAIVKLAMQMGGGLDE